MKTFFLGHLFYGIQCGKSPGSRDRGWPFAIRSRAGSLGSASGCEGPPEKSDLKPSKHFPDTDTDTDTDTKSADTCLPLMNHLR